MLFSFDGAGSHEHWQRVMAAAKQVNAHVTGFLSGVYLLPHNRKEDYVGPGHAPGESSIGFGGTWAKVGQGTLAVGCVTAAVMGQVYLGLPCVIGGGATNAALYYMND